MEKKVVYESRPKLIALLLIGWGFVIMCLWVRYWSGLVFFGLCAAVTTYRLLDPSKELLFYGTSAYRAHLARELEAWQANPGDFTYSEDDFRIPSPSDYQVIAWNDLRAVFGYKRDWYATDELCLDIFFQDSSFTITEETAGWHIFVEQLEAHFPLLPGWFGEVAVPAFETRLTLLYEREGRSFAQAVPAYYSADAQPD